MIALCGFSCYCTVIALVAFVIIALNFLVCYCTSVSLFIALLYLQSMYVIALGLAFVVYCTSFLAIVVLHFFIAALSTRIALVASILLIALVAFVLLHLVCCTWLQLGLCIALGYKYFAGANYCTSLSTHKIKMWLL